MSFFYGQLVIGPAGSGKSTYCHALQDMAEVLRRNVIVINLDPAAETFKYRCDVDIRDLITLDDVMEELCLGPNGGLVYCMEYLCDNIDWFQEQVGDLGNDDYVLFDFPGQIELYTHLDLIHKLIKTLQYAGFNLCSMYMLDVTFLSEHYKFVSGVLCALTAMMQVALPHLTVLTKCDLVKDKDLLDQYLNFAENIDFLPEANQKMFGERPDKEDDEEEETKMETEDESKLSVAEKELKSMQEKNKEKQSISAFDKKYQRLNHMLKETISEHSMISMKPLDISDEESIKNLLIEADTMIQFGENLEPDEKAFEKAEQYLDNQFEAQGGMGFDY